MKITVQQSRILGAAAFMANASMAELAKLSGCKEHVVRSTLQNLMRRGGVEVRMFNNPYAIGITEYQVFVSVLSKGDAARRTLTRVLQSSPSVSWLREMGGQYDLNLMIRAKTLREVADFFDQVDERAKGVEFEKCISSQLSLTYFSPKFLGPIPRQVANSFIRYGYVHTRPEFDDLDLRIIQDMRSTQPLPFSQVARRLGLSGTTLAYRIGTLREREIILGFGYVVNSTYFGFTPYIFLVEMRRLNASIRERFFKFCMAHRDILVLVETVGNWDYQVGVRVKNAEQIPGIVASIEDAFPTEIRKITPEPMYAPLKLRDRVAGIVM